MPKIERVIPVLRVTDLHRGREFYREELGFEVEWGGEEDSAVSSLTRDGQSLMLSQERDEVSQACVWIGLEDDSLFERFRSLARRVVVEPRDMPWAFEMKGEDPDGNLLWLGTAPREEREEKLG